MTGTNWDGIARELQFTDATAMFTKFYIEMKMPIEELARRFNVSQGMIRGQLAKAGVEVRKRGGANYSKIVMSKQLADECNAKGTKLVAEELGVSYTALHKALKRFETPTAQTEEVAASPLPPSSGGPETGE